MMNQEDGWVGIWVTSYPPFSLSRSLFSLIYMVVSPFIVIQGITEAWEGLVIQSIKVTDYNSLSLVYPRDLINGEEFGILIISLK
jgi:hypothetical protein